VVYYTLLSMGLLTLFYAVNSIREGKIRELFVTLGLAVVAGLIAFGGTAVSTLPVQEYSKETMRGGRTELTSGASKLESRNGLSKDYASPMELWHR